MNRQNISNHCITKNQTMNEWESKERRSYVRFPVSIPLMYLTIRSLKGAWVNTFDLSSKGMGLETKEQLSPGVTVDVQLCMPDNGERIITTGKVIWNNCLSPARYRVGVALDAPELKPIPLILRSIQVRSRY